MTGLGRSYGIGRSVVAIEDGVQAGINLRSRDATRNIHDYERGWRGVVTDINEFGNLTIAFTNGITIRGCSRSKFRAVELTAEEHDTYSSWGRRLVRGSNNA